MKKARRKMRSGERSRAELDGPLHYTISYREVLYKRRRHPVQITWWHFAQIPVIDELRAIEERSFRRRHQSYSMQTAACRDRADLVRVLRGLPPLPVVFAPAAPASTTD